MRLVLALECELGLELALELVHLLAAVWARELVATMDHELGLEME